MIDLNAHVLDLNGCTFGPADMVATIARKHLLAGDTAEVRTTSGKLGTSKRRGVSPQIITVTTATGLHVDVMRTRITGEWRVKLDGFEGISTDIDEACHLCFSAVMGR